MLKLINTTVITFLYGVLTVLGAVVVIGLLSNYMFLILIVGIFGAGYGARSLVYSDSDDNKPPPPPPLYRD